MDENTQKRHKASQLMGLISTLTVYIQYKHLSVTVRLLDSLASLSGRVAIR